MYEGPAGTCSRSGPRPIFLWFLLEITAIPVPGTNPPKPAAQALGQEDYITVLTLMRESPGAPASTQNAVPSLSA
jgi:hypothetical protein